MDPCWFRFIVVLEYEEVSFDSYLCFIRRFWLESSELFEFAFVSLILLRNPKINRCFFFFFFAGSEPLKFFPFSSQSPLSVIVRSLLLSVMNFVLELQKEGSMMMIQPWISENQRKFHWICSNFASGKLGFMELFFNFLSLLEFWSNWIERECFWGVCDVASDLWILTLTCTVVAFYRLPHVPLSQWKWDTWTWTACVALVDWTEKKGTKNAIL